MPVIPNFYIKRTTGMLRDFFITLCSPKEIMFVKFLNWT